MDIGAAPPKVFLSYCWTSEAYQAKVVDLAERLVNDGVDILLDVWDLQPGQDKFAFMERMVTDPSVKRVLLLCEPKYAEKADARSGGVGTESQIVSAEVYAKTEQRKFIPVIMQRADDGSSPLPRYLAARIYIDLSVAGAFATEYEKLLRDIFDKPLKKRPALGKPPSFLITNDAVSARTHLIRNASSIDYVRGANARQPEQLLDSVLRDITEQRLTGAPVGDADEVVISKIQEMKLLRDIAVEGLRSSLARNEEQKVVDEILPFFEGLLSACDRPTSGVWNDGWSDHIRFVAMEAWLYTIAEIIRTRKWSVGGRLLATPLCASVDGQYVACGYGELNRYLRTIDEHRNRRLGLGRTSVTADLLKERADVAEISFEMIQEAEFILCVRGILAAPIALRSRWFPRTLVYCARMPAALPLCVRWRAGRDTDGIPELLEVSSYGALRDGLAAAREAKKLGEYHFNRYPIEVESLAGISQ